MKVKKLFRYAKLPQKAHAGDLGYDLFAAEYATIHKGETKLISTGISIQLPEGYGALIRDRSSVSTKKNLFVVAGVIDNGYTGEIKVALYSASDRFEQIQEGDKIAQLILIPTVDFKVEEVVELESLDGRGENGFGSTGT